MSGHRLFVDTNILLYYLHGEREIIDIIGDKEVAISFITELELLCYPANNQESKEIINGLLSSCLIVDMNQAIKDLTVEFRKQSRLKLPDSIIAATSSYLKLPLLTADKQFRMIKGIEIILYEL
ncbi:MAG TPA: type II toxin-antitoxin system VapC family toxin [Daejeonella sp.]|nr:type II toxin-antitoxin system VapC family toxin [Daejeonella sp.]